MDGDSGQLGCRYLCPRGDCSLPPRISSPQKLASPTFQLPSWWTATPLWLGSATLPLTRIE
jgi:hypothetical protein